MDFIRSKKNLIFFVIVTFFILANLFTMTFFPFFHSDEVWLSSQSLDIFITKSFKTTESFFDLYPRTPHGLKLIFNTLQIIIGQVMGHNFITYRLLSFIMSLIALLFFYKTLRSKNLSTLESSLWTLALGLNIQWFYMSHFARQEAFIICIYIMAFYYYIKDKPMATALIISLGFFIHPNAYIVALMFFILFILKKDKGALVKEIGIGGSSTLAIIGISIYLNPSFIKDYTAYGNSLGVGSSLITRTLNFKDFFIKLFYQISGTYYVPDIKLYLIILLVLFIFSFFMIKKEALIPATLWGFIIGSWIIGRYNATSIILVIPIVYYAMALVASSLFKGRWVLPILLIALSIWTLVPELILWEDDYTYFIEEISNHVDDESKALANLNMAYAFEPGNFYDYRNLAYLEDKSFVEYIEDRNIKYIIWTDEMDYISRNENWQILYGDMGYYNEAKAYLENNCSLVHSFEDNLYGVRIVRYMMEPSWKVYIYKVKG